MLKTITINNNQSELVISEFGAQIISWKKAERNILYDNPKLITDKSKALRGGAPVCFPWFNKGISFAPELKPSHGAARVSDWKLKNKSNSDCTLNFQTNSHSGLPLIIEVNYSVTDDAIRAFFEVVNRSDRENQFELALHTYFSSSNPEKTQISGINDSKIPFIPQIPIDQIFRNHSDNISLKLTGRTVQILNKNFSKSVVWHPGLNHGIADLEDGTTLAPFICVESLTEIVTLAPNGGWQGSVTYSV